MIKWLVGFCLLTFAVFLGAGAGIVSNATTVFPGIKVDGYELGGASRAELEKVMKERAGAISKSPLVFYHQGQKYMLSPGMVEYRIDEQATVETVWRYGREGSLWHRINSIYLARSQGQELPLKIQYNEGKLNDVLEQWAKQINRPAKNASLSLATGAIVPEQLGLRLDIEKNKAQILREIRERKNKVLIVEEMRPHITTADIEKSGVKDLLGIYTTYFNAGDINRTSNIQLAVEKINGTLLKPGEVFSYNNIVGPRDVQNGFKEALEIVDGEFVPGIGGGVCQVSSTLYNAVLYAGLKIVDRTNHSKPLSYIPVGRDATVAYGYLDFRFANTTETPVLILAEVQGNQLKMGVFGKDIGGETIKIVVVDQKEIPPRVTKKEDSLLYIGESKEEQQGLPGYEATALRIWLVQGKEVRREILSKDRYLPTNAVIRVGTKPVPAAVELPPAATTTAPVKKDAEKSDLEKRPVQKKDVAIEDAKVADSQPKTLKR